MSQAPGAPRSVRQVIWHTPGPVRILIAGVFANRTGSFYSTFLVLLLRQEGFSLRFLPLVLLIAGAATPAGSLLGGWAADRFSRKTALVAATLLAGGALALLGEARGRPLIIAGVFCAALLSQAYIPAASAMLVDYTGEQDRVPVFALFRLAINLGAALGPVIAVFVAPHGLHLLFLIDAATYVAFGAWLWAALPGAASQAAPELPDAAGAGPDAAPDAAVPPRPSAARLLAFYAGVLLVTSVYYQYSSTISLAVTARHSTAAYATLLTINGAVIICFELPLTSVTRRLAWRLPMVAGIALVAVGIAMCGALHAYPLIALGVAVWTAGEMCYSPVVNAAVASFSPPGRVGRYQGHLATTQAIGVAVGPALGILIYGYSPAALWIGCLVAGGLACTAIYLAGRGPARSLATSRA